jgi:hypothetical protein
VARKRVASKLVLAGVAYECEERSGLGCWQLHVLAAYGDTPLMHDDRCIAVRRDSVLLWDDEVLFFTFVPRCLFLSPNTFRSFPAMCFFDRVSEMEDLEDILAAGIQQT